MLKIAVLVLGSLASRKKAIGLIQLMGLLAGALVMMPLTFMVMATSALATWGNNCKPGNGYHCYALSEWEMTGGEGVTGAFDDVYTWAMNTPYDFVDNEMWVSWTNTQGWIESGTNAISSKGCCTLYPFFAQNTNGGAYSQWISETPITLDTNENYEILSDRNGGTWTIYWELPGGSGHKFEANVTGGYKEYATRLQNGTEIATGSKPEDWASSYVTAQYFNYTWHEWVGAYTKAHAYTTTTGMCAYNDGNGIGSIWSGTC